MQCGTCGMFQRPYEGINVRRCILDMGAIVALRSRTPIDPTPGPSPQKRVGVKVNSHLPATWRGGAPFLLTPPHFWGGAGVGCSLWIQPPEFIP